MDEENITQDTLDEKSSGEGAVESQTPSIASILSRELGKDFRDDETALKAVKDTFAFVGKNKEQAKVEVQKELQIDEVVRSVAEQNRQMSTELFYLKNPQYDKPEIRNFIETTGKAPKDVVATESFKDIFTKLEGFEKAQKSANVLKSNSKTKTKEDVDEYNSAKKTGTEEDWAQVLSSRLGL
jgi:hypothetical protein